MCVYVFVRFAICTEHQSKTMCANPHKNSFRASMLAVRLAIMRKILIAGGHTTSNAPEQGRPQGAASLFAFASSVPVCVCVVDPCAADLYISFCMFSKCRFGSCHSCGWSLHVSVSCLCLLLLVLSNKAEAMCANLHRTATQQACLQYDLTITRDIFIAGGHTAPNAPDLLRPPQLSGAGPA